MLASLKASADASGASPGAAGGQPGAQPPGMPDFASMMGMMGGMPGMGALGGGGVPPIADPETAYATQIQQLVDMGTVLGMRTAELASQYAHQHHCADRCCG